MLDFNQTEMQVNNLSMAIKESNGTGQSQAVIAVMQLQEELTPLRIQFARIQNEANVQDLSPAISSIRGIEVIRSVSWQALYELCTDDPPPPFPLLPCFCFPSPLLPFPLPPLLLPCLGSPPLLPLLPCLGSPPPSPSPLLISPSPLPLCPHSPPLSSLSPSFFLSCLQALDHSGLHHPDHPHPLLDGSIGLLRCLLQKSCLHGPVSHYINI